MSEHETKQAPVNWREMSASLNYWGSIVYDRSEDGIVIRDADSPIVVRKYGGRNDRHALAALCLYGQPFGFTREDVELLRDWDVAEHAWSSEELEQRSAMAARLAAKLAALLPPEDATP